jgi:hypothetical protein
MIEGCLNYAQLLQLQGSEVDQILRMIGSIFVVFVVLALPSIFNTVLMIRPVNVRVSVDNIPSIAKPAAERPIDERLG